jgi:mono/diheme cytochrome c family protein
MKKISYAAMFLALAISPAAFAGGNAAAGKDVFMKHCAACHGQDGNGKEAVAKMMKVTIPPLPSKGVQALSDADLTKVINGGKGKMMAVKGLSAADVTNTIAFIRSIAKK